MAGPAPAPVMLPGHVLASLAVSVTVLAPAFAGPPPQPQDLKRLSIEELMEIDITLATREPEPVATTAAAVSVITRDDIRRSGVTTIADALHLATGVHVARFNNGTWSITARGFNGSTPNKLLVMVDGRTEYSPLFTGVFWNILDYVLEDIERIEVIRGPGATMWGANAVNGVVNIITRHTTDTQGTYASLAAGNEDRAIAEFRHGGGWRRATWRIYGKFAQRDDQQLSTGIPAGDSRTRGQAGFRFDSPAGETTWLLKGDVFHARDEFIDRQDGEWTEIALQGRWTRAISAGSRLAVQSYYRREYRNIARQLTHHIDTVDVDFQHAVRPSDRHNLIWGAGYRRNQDGHRPRPRDA
jgi:iron complex outermembrane recepter protein